MTIFALNSLRGLMNVFLVHPSLKKASLFTRQKSLSREMSFFSSCECLYFIKKDLRGFKDLDQAKMRFLIRIVFFKLLTVQHLLTVLQCTKASINGA